MQWRLERWKGGGGDLRITILQQLEYAKTPIPLGSNPPQSAMLFNCSLWARVDTEIQRGIVQFTIMVPVLYRPIKQLLGLKKSLELEY